MPAMKQKNKGIQVSGRKVIGIETHNEAIKDKFKTVFYVEADNGSRMCIYWERTGDIAVGDEVDMQGRLNDDGIFLVWSLLIKHEV